MADCINIQDYKSNIPIANKARHIIYVAREKENTQGAMEIIGHFVVADEIRKGTREVIQFLKKMGKEISICTGTDEETARAYAAELGIESVRANCKNTTNTSPKRAYIRELAASGPVAMVGDGINDIEAFTEASAIGGISIAIQSPAANKLSLSRADAVIPEGSLAPLVPLCAISQQTMRGIHFDLGFSLFYNFVSMISMGMLLPYLCISLNPGLAALLMIVQSSIVLLNKLQSKYQSVPQIELEKPRAGNRNSLSSAPVSIVDTTATHPLSPQATVTVQPNVAVIPQPPEEENSRLCRIL